MKPVNTFNARGFNVVYGDTSKPYPLYQRYLATRTFYPRRNAAEILAALRGLRSDIKPATWPRCSAYNPRSTAQESRSRRHVRWIEDTARAGLRFIGFADELAGLRHTGWYSDPFGDSHGLMRGVVYQLPAHGGRSVFVYGYADPFNDGAALLCFDNDADSKEEAARYADSFAEHMAEEEREYQTKELAAERVREARETVKGLRSELRQIREQLAACRRRCKNWRKSRRYSALLGAVRRDIERLRETVAEELRTASQLEAEPWRIVSP